MEAFAKIYFTRQRQVLFTRYSPMKKCLHYLERLDIGDVLQKSQFMPSSHAHDIVVN